jgi:hypothetical protein
MGLTRPRFSQFDTTISSISDPVTVLNKSSTLANVDVGFVINRNGGALANTAIFWNEGANTFALAFTTNSGELPNANISISEYANLRVNTLTADTATFSSTGAIKIPSGNTAQRTAGTTGQIRFNTSTSQFEGYQGASWSSLGGVRSVDNNTYIIAESSAGAGDNILQFFAGGNRQANLSSAGLTVTANVSAGYFTGNGSQLSGINSFSNVFISGQSPVQADSISDTLTLVAGSGITITTDAANDSVTFTTVSTLGAFGADGEFGLVTDIVTLSEDLGDLASTNSITYDLGTLVSASGLIYPDQLVLPGYATASLPSASVDAQLVYDSTARALKYTTGSNWTTVLDGTGNTIVTGNVTATGGWGGTLSSAGVLGGVPMAFFAERTSTGTAGGVMSHGNGSTTGKGLRMPYAGKLIAGTMFGANVNGTITIDAYLNGTANTSYRFSQTGALTDVGETQNWSSAPLTFAAGDTLGWYQTAVPTTANAYTVTFFVTYN